MTRIFLCALLSWCSTAIAAPLVVETDPLTPEQQREKFHLPPGFEIQLVVANPDIGQPMNMAFDAAGRLWVTHSVEYPYPVEEPGVEPRDGRFQGMGKPPARDKVTILSDFGPDGKARKVQHFATGLNIPIGVLPLQVRGEGLEVREKSGGDAPPSNLSSLTSHLTSAIVFSIPNLYLLTDTDGDLVADEKKVLYGPFGNLDTHGMVNSLTRHLDGWVYANHGFRNTSKVKGTDGHEITMNSGNTFRFKIDGSRIEQVTWGQVNPFGMTVDRWGNFYNADCHSMPLTCLIPGAYYESFGKPHDGLGFGPKMIDHGHGSTGICGVAWYEAPQFPSDYHDCIFLCNPVNGIVHRDRIVFHGSSPWAETQPEFITCDDGWFRPVDVKLGPDGALYVADFYNAVIGHYEVPLDNPRRDREKGRIWRVVYTGDRESRIEERERLADSAFSGDPTGRPSPPPDLTALSNEQLIEKLGDPNIVVRTLATNLLVDRKPTESQVQALRRVLRPNDGKEIQRAMARWVLCRGLGDASDNAIHIGTMFGTVLDRVSIAQVMGYSHGAPAHYYQTLLSDPHPMVKRAAALAITDQMRTEDVSTLVRALDYVATETPEDTHLRHALMIALRDQITYHEAGTDEYEHAFLMMSMALTNYKELMQPVVMGSRNEAGSGLALMYVSNPTTPPNLRSAMVKHAAKHGDHNVLVSLINVCALRDDVQLQAEYSDIKAMFAGLNERSDGASILTAEDKQFHNAWASHIVDGLLTLSSLQELRWAYSPNPGPANPQSAFVVQERASADGDAAAKYFSTLPAGEQRQGTYRSDAFVVPKSLSFYFAGHNGFPDKPLSETSFVRLINAETGVEITRTFPPRNDLAQLVTWDLSTSAGQRGYVEIVDGDAASAYAWLAVGRFSLEALNPQEASPVQQAVELIASLKLTEMEPKLHEIMLDKQQGMSTRLAAADAYLQLHPDSRKLALHAVAKHSPVSALQEGCLVAIEENDDALTQKLLTDIMKAATGPVQGQLARVLFNDPPGGEELLRLVEAGSASARLLTQADIVDRLNSIGIADLENRLQALTKDLPPLSEQTAELIKGRKAAFDATAESPEGIAAGAAVFKTNCAACHQFKGEGNKIGPQLDGIGNRGVDRLLEDILDPNRNVDGAFKTTVIALNDGRVLTGLKRREEGATIIFANSEGKEFSVNVSDIDEQKQSSLSLMPVTLGEKLTEQEMAALLRYLVSGGQAPIEKK